MPNKHGDFIWYELMTNDAEATQDFYGAVVGWSFAPAGQNDKDYRQFSMNNTIVGGLLPLTPEMRRMAPGRAGWAMSVWTMLIRRRRASKRQAAKFTWHRKTFLASGALRSSPIRRA